MQRSADGGVTWDALQTVAGAGITSRDGMPGVARLQRGDQVSWVCIFESVVQNHFRTMTVQSDDAGASWPLREVLHDPVQGHNAGSPQIVTLPGGTLVAAYMSDEASDTVSWPDHAEIHMQLAMTEAAAVQPLDWQKPAAVSPSPSYWPGLLSRNPTDFFVVYDHSGSSLVPVTLDAARF